MNFRMFYLQFKATKNNKMHKLKNLQFHFEKYNKILQNSPFE